MSGSEYVKFSHRARCYRPGVSVSLSHCPQSTGLHFWAPRGYKTMVTALEVTSSGSKFQAHRVGFLSADLFLPGRKTATRAFTGRIQILGQD